MAQTSQILLFKINLKTQELQWIPRKINKGKYIYMDNQIVENKEPQWRVLDFSLHDAYKLFFLSHKNRKHKIPGL